jgi:hypothetical protein
MRGFVWILALAAGIPGIVLFLASLALAREAAMATVRAARALCCGGLPYVIARAADAIMGLEFDAAGFGM